MKIFQIGFNRCGTLTLHDFFCANGMKGIHWDNGKLAKRIFHNLASEEPILAGYEDYDVFTDMDSSEPDEILEAYKLYPQFADAYPDAVFILNTRKQKDWVRSRLRHAKGKFAARQKSALGISSDDDLVAHWMREWDDHHEKVQAFFHGSPYRFFVFDIDRDGPQKLAEMLPDLDLDCSLYAHKHRQTLESRIRHSLRAAFAKVRSF